MPTNLPSVNKLFRFEANLHKILLIIGLYLTVSKVIFPPNQCLFQSCCRIFLYWNLSNVRGCVTALDSVSSACEMVSEKKRL